MKTADAALRSNQGTFLDAARATLETARVQMTGDLAQKQTAIEGIVQAAHALRAVRLGNGEEPGQAFAAYRAEP